MSNNNKFKILGHDATLIDGRVEVSVADADIGSKILIRLSGALFDKKFKSLRINMPNKIIFVSVKDSQNLLVRAEDPNDKSNMN